MKITKKSPLTGKENTLKLDITPEQYHKWQEGEKIQHAMPHLTPDEREFLISGCYPGEYDIIFPEEDQ